MRPGCSCGVADCAPCSDPLYSRLLLGIVIAVPSMFRWLIVFIGEAWFVVEAGLIGRHLMLCRFSWVCHGYMPIPSVCKVHLSQARHARTSNLHLPKPRQQIRAMHPLGLANDMPYWHLRQPACSNSILTSPTSQSRHWQLSRPLPLIPLPLMTPCCICPFRGETRLKMRPPDEATQHMHMTKAHLPGIPRWKSPLKADRACPNFRLQCC